MNHLKGLAIAAAIAAALLVVAGTGSSSATVLCKTKSSPCSSPYLKGTLFKGILTPGTTAMMTLPRPPVGQSVPAATPQANGGDT